MLKPMIDTPLVSLGCPQRLCPDDPKRLTWSWRRSAVGETRKLAAILVSDVVGYSRLAGADEDRILARLRALRSDLIDPTIAVHHGRVVKRTGDGAVVEFRSVVDAVRCAVEIQRAMVERNAEGPGLQAHRISNRHPCRGRGRGERQRPYQPGDEVPVFSLRWARRR
jgi:class 3 adenylate cyclase